MSTIGSILRILVLLSLAARYHHAWISLIIGCLFFVVASWFNATIRPYKSNLSNNVDIWMLGLLAILSLAFLIETIYPETQTSRYSLVAILLLLGVPHMVLIFYICYVLAKKVGITQYLKRKYNSLNWLSDAQVQLKQTWRLIPILTPCQTGWWTLGHTYHFYTPEKAMQPSPQKANSRLMKTHKGQVLCTVMEL